MTKRYPEEFLDNLRNHQYTITEDGQEITYKRIPDCEKDHVLDQRVYRSLHIPMLLAGLIPFPKNASPLKSIRPLRKTFNGIKSKPITRKDTQVRELTFKHDGTDVPVKIILPRECQSRKLPVLYYMHGGGFFAGSSRVILEACKLFAESYPCIAVAIDYRLAPENPYPAGHTDCFAGLRWIYENIEPYGGDKNKIFVSGDSAGGNMALYCIQKDRENGTHMVKAQALYYPTVNMTGKVDEYFNPGKQNYHVEKKYEHIVFGMLEWMGQTDMGLILGTDETSGPYLSPYWADLQGMPPTIIIFGEYDFLFAECRAFGKKLYRAGVPVKTIVYKGMIHAFLDNVGVLAQAEDSVLEVVEFMRNHLNDL